MIAVVVSRGDDVSVRIGAALLDAVEWERDGDAHRYGAFELREFETRHLDIVDAADAFDDPEFLVFASRHAGDTGPLLTAHFTGNVGSAEFGGSDNELAVACPQAQKRAVAALTEHAPDGFDVGIECTHHGPSRVGVPSMFVELGSGPPEWKNENASAAVARAILDLAGTPARQDRTVVGFGGGHYAPRFRRLVTETLWAVGHIASDWALDEMGDLREHRDVVAAVFEKSGTDLAVVDGTLPALEAVIEDLGYRVVSETWVRTVCDRDLDVVATLERELCPIDDGLRFGERRGPFDAVDLPEELLAVARAVDESATRRAVEKHTVAFETEHGGSVASGRAAIPRAGYDALVDTLVEIVEPAHEHVERHADRVVLHDRTFDPGTAKELGVPDGPLFGQLANGESVTVGDREVTPDEVMTPVTTEIRLDRYA